MNIFFYFYKNIYHSNFFKFKQLAIPLLLIIILSMMILPLPTFILDFFFTFNIILSILILLVALFTKHTLDFASFPTMLLFSTLLRLALNIASTRIILLNGHVGTLSAGKVIEAFGHFLVGGNFFIGIVVFIILLIINFMVITKGAGRIAEVGARFALDGMPGKQMAIDADLNAGLIGESEAKNRRIAINREADFYGSMDGSSKFVRGDAVAGIFIMIVNILGGLTVGIFQHNMSLKKAAATYTLLTIGDGLVAQIPALIISTAVGVIVTRISGDEDVGEQMLHQLFSDPLLIAISGCILGVLGLVPGMPNFIFLFFMSLFFILSWIIYNQKIQKDNIFAQKNNILLQKKELKLSWENVKIEKLISIELGSKLISLVNGNESTIFLKRIQGIRKKYANNFGILVPPVYIFNNESSKDTYFILIKGVIIATGKVIPDKLMALDSGNVDNNATLEGIKVTEPTFGMPAIWIEKKLEYEAKTKGYLIVDASSVIVTHLNFVIQHNLHELLDRYETSKLLERINQLMPGLVNDLTPNLISLTIFHKVLKNLLLEQISIKDIRTIIETLIDYAPSTKDVQELTSIVRLTLGQYIVQKIFNNAKEIKVLGLEHNLEKIFIKIVQDKNNQVLEPTLKNNFLLQTEKAIKIQDSLGEPLVLVVKHDLRVFISKILRTHFTHLVVLSDMEIRDQRKIYVTHFIGSKM
ncbi:flagellar biosynthesis protein FlhA [Buchnera aphidicola (Thelaxes californica)]|uniref:Flagellar biosynthesis protein FlhA n=1 Tax=Buchnera aphidicola (Thelaxes californica) TaxID=1315998 RepID=A0A4D6Y9P0_9GAMM|nr:flagellar biosynthesis protein FlhA [Buchnera aphidicola]QCI26726.1 flagellar biosynthesis protein FlhA [Buchnera aphidicola (Thelaxes californica)]